MDFWGTIHETNVSDSRVGVTEQKEVSSIWRSQKEQFASRLGAGEKLKIDHFASWYIKERKYIYIYIYLYKKNKNMKIFCFFTVTITIHTFTVSQICFLTKQSNIVPFLKNLVNLNATVKKSVWYSAQSGIIYSTDILRVNWVFTVQFCVSTSTLVLFVYLLFFKVLFKIVFGPLHGCPSCWCNGAFVLLASHTIVSIYVFDCRTSFHSILVFCSACVFFSSTCT